MTLDQVIKSAGIQRKIDELGRVVIPIELRRSLGWGDKHQVEVVPTSDGVFIKSAAHNPEKDNLIAQLKNLDEVIQNPEIKTVISGALQYLQKG